MTGEGGKEGEPIRPSDRPGLIDLTVTFFRMGLVAFGGLLLLLALIEREWVDRRGLLTRDGVREAVTYTRLLPGSGGPLVVSYLGYHLGGIAGSALATVSYLLPGLALMTGLAVGFVELSSLSAVEPAIDGLLAAVVGIQAVWLWRFAVKGVRDPAAAIVLVIGLVGSLVFGVPAPLLVAAAGAFGVLYYARSMIEEKADG